MSYNTRDTSNTDHDFIERAKHNALHRALHHANAEVVEFKSLALVDLQGLYLRLHEVLTGISFPIESGVVLGRLAGLQINDAFVELQKVIVKKLGNSAGMLEDLYKEIEIEITDGKAYLAKPLQVLSNGKYLHVEPAFEVFYATPPLADLEWRLAAEAKKGSWQAREQLDLLKAGKVRVFSRDRDYRFFSDFVNEVNGHSQCRGHVEGFFSFRVGPKGLQNWDEKCVDTSIVIRAMEALFRKEAEALCVISSDQDFIPLREKCKAFDVQFFQKDAAKFFAGEYVGRKITDLGKNYIAGTFNPEWPIHILTDCLAPSGRGYSLRGITKREALALASLHNAMHDYKVNLDDLQDGAFRITLTKTDGTEVEHRVDPQTKMRQVKLTTLEY